MQNDSNKKIDKMTEGSIFKHLINYAIPLIIGNIILVTYEAVDAIIIAKKAGEVALAGVATVAPIMNLVIHLVSGVSIGASVLIAEFYGADDNEKIKKEISTVIITGEIFTAIIVGICFFFSKAIFTIMQVPTEVMEGATTYLKVVSIGFLFVFLYNILSNSLRAIGDTKTGTYFLIISSVINLVFDILFVFYFDWGIFGAAIATLFSQIVACTGCAIYVQKCIPIMSLKLKDLVVDFSLYKKTMSYGLITALQQTVPPLSRVILISNVNTLGVSAMSAYSATSKMDDYTIIPQQSIAFGIMTCVAQNRGGKTYWRIRETLRKGIILELIYSLIIQLITFFFAYQIMLCFAPNPASAMVELGIANLKFVAFFYFMCGIANALQSFFRGMGDMKITLIASVSQVTVRVIVAIILIPKIGFIAVAYALMVGWVVMLIIEIPYYIFCKLNRWREMLI